MQDKTTPDNPPAFPTQETTAFAGTDGMSLHDYFAGQAMAAIIAGQSEGMTAQVTDDIRAGGHEAKTAYAYADAMLAAREREVGDAG